MSEADRNHDFLQYRPRMASAIMAQDLEGLRAAVDEHQALAPMTSLATAMFIRAVQHGFWDGARLMLDAGAPVTGFDSSARTALHYCARFHGDANALAMVDTLLDRGCSIDHRSNVGDTALVEAVHNGNVAFFQLLRQRGASMRASNTDIGQMLKLALTCAHPAPMIEALLEDQHCEQLLRRDADADTLLHAAAGKALPEVCALLCRLGLRGDVINSYLYTPVHYLGRELTETAAPKDARTRLGQALDTLLAHGGSLSARDHEGNTPLLKVVHWIHGSIGVELLLDSGADINAVNDMGRSALHEAVNFGAHAAISVLLARGIDLNIRDPGGFTAEDLARHKDKHRMADLLQAAGALQALETQVAEAPRTLRGRI